MVTIGPFRAGQAEQGGPDAALNQHLGISVDAILEALGQGNTERGFCTPQGAKQSAGFYLYNGVVAGLTLQLRPFGYERIDLNSLLPLLINHDRKVTIGVCSGNPATGTWISNIQPRSKNSKGELTYQLIQRNQSSEMTPLFDISMGTEVEGDPVADYDFWMVLFYLDKAKSEIRCEVSRPMDISAGGIVTSWRPRIVLPPYFVMDIPDEDPNGGFDSVDVPVEPR